MALPVGTILLLDLPPLDEAGAAAASGVSATGREPGFKVGDVDPWSRVRVAGRHDYGGDRGGEVLIVAPVTFSAVSSPREVDEQVLLTDLGYRVEAEGEDADWTTPDEELIR